MFCSSYCYRLDIAHNLGLRIVSKGDYMRGLKKKEGLKILIGAAAIILVSSAIGVLANISLVNQLINSECIIHSRASHREASRIDLAEAKKKFDEGQAIFIDARCLDDYNWGHIKRAISLPLDSLEMECPSVIAQFPREKEIITYCSGSTDCQLSIDLAKKLSNLGYLHVNAFFGGWLAWEAAGYPIEPGN